MSVDMLKKGVWFIGGTDDQSSRADDNGGGCSRAWWDSECPNGTQVEFAAAYAKLMNTDGGPIISQNNVNYDDADNTIQGVGIHVGVEVGMIAYIIETTIPDENVGTGRYEITAVETNQITCAGIDGDGETEVNVRIGGALDELELAYGDISASIYSQTIYTNLNEDLSSTISLGSGGSTLKNTFKRIIGFNTIPGDMSVGEAYYQSPVHALRDGIDSSKCVTFDMQGNAFDIFTISGDNISMENIYPYNAGAGKRGWFFTGTPENLTFWNCRSSLSGKTCLGAVNGLFWNDLYSTMVEGHAMVLTVGGLGTFMNGCIFEQELLSIYNSCNVFCPAAFTSCIFIGGQYGLNLGQASISVMVQNCTFYNNGTYGVRIGSPCSVTIFSSIFVVAVGVTAIQINAAGGTVLYNDYNCFIEIDGTPATAFANDYAGGEVTLIGKHSIEVDPLFMDPANGNFGLKSESPCLMTGKPILDGYMSIGAWPRISRIRR